MNVATAGDDTSSSPFEALKDLRTTATESLSPVADQAATSIEASLVRLARSLRKELKVVFDHVDTDSLLCAWAFCRHIARLKKTKCTPVLVPSGEKLPDDEAQGFEVEYVDMGGGDCDHHGKGLVYTSSFDLVLQKYGLVDDPGMQVLLELSKKADNAVQIPWDSIHHIVTGTLYDQQFRTNNEVDHSKVLDYAFVTFDICYAQTRYRDNTLKQYPKVVKEETLENGYKIVLLDGPAKFRGVAFERGVDLVIAVEPADKKNWSEGKFVQLMVNRTSKLDLAPLAAHLRYAEMANRGVKAKFSKLDVVGFHPQVPGWYLLDPQPYEGLSLHKLLVCGTPKHPGTKETRSVLTPLHIKRLVSSKLRELPPKDPVAS